MRSTRVDVIVIFLGEPRDEGHDDLRRGHGVLAGPDSGCPLVEGFPVHGQLNPHAPTQQVVKSQNSFYRPAMGPLPVSCK